MTNCDSIKALMSLSWTLGATQHRKNERMKLFLTIFCTATIAALSAYAGGLGDAILETAPVVMAPDQSASGSVPSWVVPVAIIAVLVGAAVLSSDGDDSGGY
jgi:phosphate/sulfate permease